MFFVLSKTVGYLVYPLSLVLLVLLVSALLPKKREKAARRLLWLGFAALWLLSTATVSNWLVQPLEKPYRNCPLPATVDVIVVLGGSIDLELSHPAWLEYGEASDRFMYAIKLARRYPQARLLFTGGTASLYDSSKTEASMLKAEAVAFGVAPERVLVDDGSRNTHENALETRRLLEQSGGHSVVLLTSAFHLRRSLACLSKVGIAAAPYGVDFRGHAGGGFTAWVPHVGALGISTLALKEYVGLWIYRWQGYA